MSEDRLAEDRPAPCQIGPSGRCHHWQRCADEMLACDQFRLHVGAFNGGRRSGQPSRIPTRSNYERIFNTIEEAEHGSPNAARHLALSAQTQSRQPGERAGVRSPAADHEADAGAARDDAGLTGDVAVRAGIVLDDWKIPIFERHLTEAGFTFEKKGNFTARTIVMTVDAEAARMGDLAIAIRAANTEARAQGHG